MATQYIKFKRSSIPGKRPSNSQMELGEVALNTNDGRLFTKKENVGIGTTVTLLNVWTENVGGGAYYNDGAIGIGTTAPRDQGTLEVVSTVPGGGIRVSSFGNNSPGFRLVSNETGAFAQNLLSLGFGNGLAGSVPGDYCIRNSSGGGILLGVSTSLGTTSPNQANGYVRLTPSGEFLIGTASTITTGTPGQNLQVTGGAYVSGAIGIGTTNPTSKLHVIGDALVSGVVTATTFNGNLTGTASSAIQLQTARTFEITGDIVASPVSFNGTGNVSLAATIQPNSVGLGTDTTGDYVKSITGTSNQITVTGGTGESSTPVLSIPSQLTAPQDVTVSRDLQVNRNLNVNGNITIGGTSATLFTTELNVADADIVLGFRTDALGNDASTDNTANHGGIAVASTEGTPLINLFIAGIETAPATYKKIMWFKSGTFAGLGTDAWLSNYAVGIGSTQFPTGVRLAAGAIHVLDNKLDVRGDIDFSGTFYQNGSPFVASRWTAGTGDDIYRLNGDVGIGTTNPSKRLHILDTDCDIKIGDITDGTPTTDGGIIFSGLGTFTSALFTEVNGEILSYGINVAQITGIETGRVGGIFRLDTRVGQFGDGNSFVVKGRSIGTTIEHNSIVINLNDGNTFLSPNKGVVVVGTSLTTGTPGQSLQVAGGAYVRDNVGIGTTNPTSKLQVQGDALITGVVTATAFNGNINAGIGTITNLNLTNLNVSGITTTSTLNVGVGGTIITTTSSGFVGIGTVSPQDVLDIRGGDLRLQSDIPEIKFRSSDGTTNQYYIGANISNTIDGGLVIGEGSGLVTGTLRILVGPTGNIGINTNNPTSKLQVQGDALITGVVTATTFVGSLSGTATSTTNIPNLTGAITSNNTTTSLGSFTSAQLATALTDETGSGSAVFATSPTLVTPILGNASATSINVLGIVTATTFVGNLTGNLNSSGVNTATTLSGTNLTYTTGNLTTLNATTGNIVTGIITNISGTNLNYTGISTITNVRSTTLNNTGVTTTAILNVGTGGTIITTTTSGFVGINSTVPGSMLAVGGTITELYAGQYWNVVTQADVGYGASQVPLNQYLGQLAFLDDISPDGLRRDGGGEDDVTVNSSGFVGIGTTNPTSKLHVIGDALVTGVVTATTFSGPLSGTATSTTNIPNLSGDVSSNNTVTTLATVNSNVGTYGGTGAIPVVTVNGKGLVTGVSTVAPNNGQLTLAVSGTGLSGSATFTANQSGASTFTVTSNATSDNTNNAIVSRNGSGGFVAGIITATNLFKGSVPVITGIGLGYTTINPQSGIITSRVGTGFTDINIVGTGVSVVGYGNTLVLDFNTIASARVVNTFTATEGQTTFSVAHNPGFVDVYVNGVRLTSGTEFVATNGTSVLLSDAANAGDIVSIITYQSVVGGSPIVTPGGSNTQLQFNDGGSFNGDSGLTYNKTSKNLNVTGFVTASTFSGNLQNTLTLNTSGTGLSGSATFNNSGASTFTVTSNATSNNTNNTIVSRDGSGNFSAGTINANLNSSGVNTAPTISGTNLNYTNGTFTNLNVLGIATATQFSTGASGTGINITNNTITGPAELIIDPAAVGDNTGSVRIRGNLFVDGTETVINSTTIELADFNVGIATTVGTNILLDGAGIGIGSTSIRKTITWNNSASALTSSEDWNLVSGKQYEINGTSVLSSTTLGSGVVNSSLTSVGTLNNLNVSGISTISVNSSTDALRITQTGTGNALLVEDSSNPDSTPFVVNASGSVGIGTTNPGAPLNVLGVSWLNNSSGDTNIRAQGLTVGYTPNADYTPGADPFDALRNTSLISRGATRPVILTFRNVDDGNAFWDFVADAKTDKFYIQRGGNFTPIITWDTFNNVGIGTTNPTSRLHVVGDVLVTGVITSTDYNSASDINLKENIQPIINPVDKVLQINGVSFNWKEDGRSSMGVIAQEIEKVLPELVSGGDSKTVNYNGLIGLLIEVVKEQQKEINNLKEKIK